MKKHYLLFAVILFSSMMTRAQVRWVDSVIAFSSELLPGPGASSAAQLIGPDPSSVCGDDTLAWSPSSDDSLQFLVLHFGGTPAPVNDISIYENYNPGAVDSVYLLNPNSELWEAVYTGAPRTEVVGECHMLHISIPTTTYNVSAMRIAINSPAIAGVNEISAVSIQNFQSTGRWVDSVYAVSSEYASGTDPWSSAQVKGLPDTYPLYGDLGTAWSSETDDEQNEWIEVHFGGTSKPVQGVDIYETDNPGAVDSVYAVDEGGDLQLLWSGAPDSTIHESRIFHITFPRTTYNVSILYITLNSPYVPGLNEIDAINLIDTFSTTGITALLNDIRFSLYPNPTYGQLKVSVSETALRKEAVLYNVEGQELNRWKIESPVSTLPVANLLSGIYLVKIEGSVQRFVKQ